MPILGKIIAYLRQKKLPIKKIVAMVKVNISTICLEKSQILSIFEEIISCIYKNLLWKIWYFSTTNCKKKKKTDAKIQIKETNVQS